MSDSNPHNGPLALVVDDSVVVRRMVCSMLRAQGLTTCEAGNGIELLEQVARQDVDLVITDLNMPHMDGLTACRQLRQNRPELPLIMLTTFQNQTNEALAAGVNVVLIKPVNGQTLTEAIEQARLACGV